MFSELTLKNNCIDCKSCEQVPQCPLKVPFNPINSERFNPAIEIDSNLQGVSLGNSIVEDLQDLSNLLSGMKKLRSRLMIYFESSG
jgi:hypothetical protein